MSTIITLKVDDELKAQATAVLEELGLDVPTAIRMYLKAVVRENGLPIDTKLPTIPPVAPIDTLMAEDAAPVAEEPARVGKTVTADELFEEDLPTPAVIEPTEPEIEPAVETAESEAPAVTIDYETRRGRKMIAALFIDAICAVPEGSLTRWSDMEEKLSREYGTEVKRPLNIRWPSTTTTAEGTELEIPYWRIVGERGVVRGDKMIEQEVQKEKLAAEGAEFEAAGHGIFTGIKVAGYKEKLV